MRPSTHARSDATGRVVLEALPAGTYALEAWHPWQRTAFEALILEVTEGKTAQASLALGLDPPPPRRPRDNALQEWLRSRQP